MAYTMGAPKEGCLRVDFDRRLKLEFDGSKTTSDVDFLAYRELDEVLGLTDLGGAALSDLRGPAVGEGRKHRVPIRTDRDLDAQALRGVQEVAGAITGRRDQKQRAWRFAHIP